MSFFRSTCPYCGHDSHEGLCGKIEGCGNPDDGYEPMDPCECDAKPEWEERTTD